MGGNRTVRGGVGMLVSYLPDPEKHPLWPEIEKLLEPAAKYGGIPVRDDDEFVWIAFEGTVLFGAGTTLLWDDGEAEIRLCGGARHKEWVRQALSVVEAWARQCKARKLTMRGRKGWARYLDWTNLGKDHDGLTIYEKELSSG